LIESQRPFILSTAGKSNVEHLASQNQSVPDIMKPHECQLF